MSQFVIANWKLNHSAETAKQWLEEFQQGFIPNLSYRVGIAPSHTEIALVRDLLKTSGLAADIDLVAQDVSRFPRGAYTGEVGAFQLREYGTKYVLIGHSERRRYFHETDVELRAKLEAIIEQGMSPILAVSEQQDVAWLSGLGIAYQELTIAYEPLGAIGTGDPATAERVAEFGRNVVERLGMGCKFIYGGSVNANDISSYFAVPQVDGFLIGGASVRAQDFLQILDKIRSSDS